MRIPPGRRGDYSKKDGGEGVRLHIFSGIPITAQNRYISDTLYSSESKHGREEEVNLALVATSSMSRRPAVVPCRWRRPAEWQSPAAREAAAPLVGSPPSAAVRPPTPW